MQIIPNKISNALYFKQEKHVRTIETSSPQDFVPTISSSISSLENDKLVIPKGPSI